MNARINQIISFLGLSQVRFAEQIGVSAGSLTHIAKGRNKPSLDIVTGILKTFPQISSDWLLFGKGEMLRPKDSTENVNSSAEHVVVREIVKPVDHITIFYQDNTYCNFYPKLTEEGESSREQ